MSTRAMKLTSGHYLEHLDVELKKRTYNIFSNPSKFSAESIRGGNQC